MLRCKGYIEDGEIKILSDKVKEILKRFNKRKIKIEIIEIDIIR